MSIRTATTTVPLRRFPSWFPRLNGLCRPVEHTRAAFLILTLFAGFLSFYGLTAGELWRTEALRAIIAAEFLRSGNWIVPTLYGEPLFTKPPGMYAAIALVSWPAGGVREWTARLPAALAAMTTIYLFFWYFTRQIGRTGGFVAGLILPMSVMWLDKATAAEIDMLQVCWVAGSILFFLRALEEEEADARGRAAKWWLAALLCVAGGVLTKWTAPAFFYGTAIPFLAWRGQLRLLVGRNHLLAATLGASVCLAWAGAAVTLAGWDPFHETVSREALQRLSPSHHREALQHMARHHQPRLAPWAEVLAHPFVILAANLPWSAVALVTLWPGFAQHWDDRGRRLLQALHCWAWPNLLFWSIIPEHAPRHSLPMFPALAGMAAMVWTAWLTGRLRWPWPRLGPGRILVGFMIVWLGVKLAFVHAVVPIRNSNREPRARGERIATHVPPGQLLYLFRLKDEGIMFYYGRPVRRLPNPGSLPSSNEPLYCILEEREWRSWEGTRPVEVVLPMQDEQGAPIVLVRVSEAVAADENSGRTPGNDPQ